MSLEILNLCGFIFSILYRNILNKEFTDCGSYSVVVCVLSIFVKTVVMGFVRVGQLKVGLG
jgi:hypothetical protein